MYIVFFRTEKTPTVVLLKPDREFEAFGYEAQNKYAKLCEKNKHKEYYYLQNFKMKLYGGKVQWYNMYNKHGLIMY